jgi:arylformamidase
VDAPLHFVEGGASVEQLSLDTLVGPSLVVGFGPDVDAITPAHLEALALPSRTERLLLKTRNSVLWDDPTHPFSSEYVALTSEAATWLVGRGVRLVGIDYLSIQRFEDAEPLTHRVLLEAGVIIVEGLNLSQVEPGPYHLACLPLKLVGSDGAPARAVLYNGG